MGSAGVHPRKAPLVLNIRLDRPVESRRLLEAERVSANRYHNELKLAAPEDVDAEVEGWLRAAYDLAPLSPGRARDPAPGREDQARVADRGADALVRLLDRRVGQADDVEREHSRSNSVST